MKIKPYVLRIIFSETFPQKGPTVKCLSEVHLLSFVFLVFFFYKLTTKLRLFVFLLSCSVLDPVIRKWWYGRYGVNRRDGSKLCRLLIVPHIHQHASVWLIRVLISSIVVEQVYVWILKIFCSLSDLNWRCIVWIFFLLYGNKRCIDWPLDYIQYIGLL